MPRYKISVSQIETIETHNAITVYANSPEEAKAKVQGMIDDGDIYDDGSWDQVSTNVELSVNERD